MKLTIKYFGMIEEEVGKHEEVLEFPNSISVGELDNHLKVLYPSIVKKSYQFAVNQSIVSNEEIISSDAEIALLPPFAGG